MKLYTTIACNFCSLYILLVAAKLNSTHVHYSKFPRLPLTMLLVWLEVECDQIWESKHRKYKFVLNV
jgi:hypothetical protein